MSVAGTRRAPHGISQREAANVEETFHRAKARGLDGALDEKLENVFFEDMSIHEEPHFINQDM